MTTTLYLHAANTTQSGTLPTTKQSSKSTTVNFDAQTVNRTMNTVIGTSQFDFSKLNTGAVSFYVSRFISWPLNQTSIAANTWTLGFGYYASASVANYPTDASFKLQACIYVWRPSTGAKVGNIVDATNLSPNHTAVTTTEKTVFLTFTGAALSGIVAGDVLCYELLTTTGGTASVTYHALIDGTTAITTDNAATTSAAAFISTPENIAFTIPPVDTTITSSQTIPIKLLIKV